MAALLRDVGGEDHGGVRGLAQHHARQVAELPPPRERHRVEEAQDERQEGRRVRQKVVRILEEEVVELEALVRREARLVRRVVVARVRLHRVTDVLVQEAQPLPSRAHGQRRAEP